MAIYHVLVWAVSVCMMYVCVWGEGVVKCVFQFCYCCCYFDLSWRLKLLLSPKNISRCSGSRSRSSSCCCCVFLWVHSFWLIDDRSWSWIAIDHTCFWLAVWASVLFCFGSSWRGMSWSRSNSFGVAVLIWNFSARTVVSAFDYIRLIILFLVCRRCGRGVGPGVHRLYPCPWRYTFPAPPYFASMLAFWLRACTFEVFVLSL